MDQPPPPPFDDAENLIRGLADTTGYHSQVPAGTPVHKTRETLDWALKQLDAGESGDRERAIRGIERVLSLQDCDPTSPTYGIWSWLLEEPLSEMSPPDWNWADFLGLALAKVLHRHADTLPADLVAGVTEGLGHASLSIFRRNVGPGYSNICALGAAVCGTAGEALDRPWMTAYAARRLTSMVEAAERSGCVPEYNSPTYYPVTLSAVESVLHACHDPALRAAATRLHRWIWGQIAEAFHPGTGEWGGPQARAYGDLLLGWQQHWFADRGIARFPTRPGGVAQPEAVACPDDLLAAFAPVEADTPGAFAEGPPIPVEGDPTRPSNRQMRRWRDGRRSLATLSSEDTWTQRRSLLGHARCDDDSTAVLRTRVTLDGQDFASGCVRQAQHGPAALCVFGLTPGKGVWHLMLDRPADGLFPPGELAVSVELIHPDATANRTGDGRFELAAGGRHVEVVAGPTEFDGQPAAWAPRQQDGHAIVTCRGHVGGDRPVAIEAIGSTFAAIALRWRLADGEDPLPAIELSGQELLDARCGADLRVAAPRTATPL